jgi:hypothetical protein
MLKAGLAEVYRGRPAAGLDLALYWNAETEAKQAEIGAWSLGDKYMSPRKWTRMQKKYRILGLSVTPENRRFILCDLKNGRQEQLFGISQFCKTVRYRRSSIKG